MTDENLATRLSPDEIRIAVADGIREAMRDPQLWASVLAALQLHAQSQAGGWLFGGLRAVLSKVAWLLTIGMAVYLVGGWSALASLFKATLFGGHS